MSCSQGYCVSLSLFLGELTLSGLLSLFWCLVLPKFLCLLVLLTTTGEWRITGSETDGRCSPKLLVILYRFQGDIFFHQKVQFSFSYFNLRFTSHDTVLQSSSSFLGEVQGFTLIFLWLQFFTAFAFLASAGLGWIVPLSGNLPFCLYFLFFCSWWTNINLLKKGYIFEFKVLPI